MPEAAPQRESISRQPGFWSRFRRLAIVRILLGSVFVVATVAVIQMGSGFAARNPNIKYFFAVTRLPALVVVGVRARDAWVRGRPQRVVSRARQLYGLFRAVWGAGLFSSSPPRDGLAAASCALTLWICAACSLSCAVRTSIAFCC